MINNFIKNNLKTILTVVVTATICISGTVVAAFQYNANQISYTINGRTLSVQDALNELYKNKDLDLNFDEYSRSYPTDTTCANTTKRLFVPNTYVVGIAENNYWNPSRVSGFNFSSSSLSVTNDSAGYGVGIPFTLPVGNTYNLSFTASNEKTYIKIMYYKRTGEFMNSVYLNDGNFTIPSNCYYTIIMYWVRGGGSTTITNFNLTRIS